MAVTRRSSLLWLALIAAEAAAFALSCPRAIGQEVARAAVVRGEARVERTPGGAVRVVLPTAAGPLTLEFAAGDAPTPPPGPGAPGPEPDPDPMGRAIDAALDSVIPGHRPAVLARVAEEVAAALAVAGRLATPDDAARFVTGRVIFGLEDLGVVYAAAIARVAAAVHEGADGESIEARLARLRAAIGERL